MTVEMSSINPNKNDKEDDMNLASLPATSLGDITIEPG